MSISHSEFKNPYIFASLNLALFICSTRTMFSFELCISNAQNHILESIFFPSWKTCSENLCIITSSYNVSKSNNSTNKWETGFFV